MRFSATPTGPVLGALVSEAGSLLDVTAVIWANGILRSNRSARRSLAPSFAP